jgi:hypothetical protein
VIVSTGVVVELSVDWPLLSGAPEVGAVDPVELLVAGLPAAAGAPGAGMVELCGAGVLVFGADAIGALAGTCGGAEGALFGTLCVPGAVALGAIWEGGKSPGAGNAPLPSGGKSVPRVPSGIWSVIFATRSSGLLVVRTGRSVVNALALISARTCCSLS